MAVGSVLPETSLTLDNDVFTYWRKQDQFVKQEIIDYISRLKQPPTLTSITAFEALYGFENISAKTGSLDARSQQDRAYTERLIEYCGVLPFDQSAAAIAAYIFPRLSKKDRNKHLRDIFIAATALAHKRGVATRNQKDFELIANHLPPNYPLLRLAVWKP
jgi:predicted nucleic acid-binding protein